MATVWSAWSGSWTPSGASARKFQSFINYTITETDTLVTISGISAGIQLNLTVDSTSWSGNVSGTGLTTKSVSDKESWYNGAKKYTWITVPDVTYQKKTTAQTVTIRAYFKHSGDGTQSATAVLTYVVPALESWAVTYNDCGGDGCPINQYKFRSISYVIPESIPVLLGHNFVGWNTAADGSGTSYSVGGSYSIDAPVELFAQWELAVFDYTFMLHDAVIHETKAVTYGTTFQFSTVQPITRSGFTFLGWSEVESSGFGEFWTDDSTHVDAINRVFYAIWTADYIPIVVNQQDVNCKRTATIGGADDDAGTCGLLEFRYTLGRLVHYNKTDGIYYENVPITSVVLYVSANNIDWSEVGRISSGFNTPQQIGWSPISADQAFIVRASIINIRETKNVFSYITKAEFTIDVNADGSGIAFGMPSGQAALESAMPIYLDILEIREQFTNGYKGILTNSENKTIVSLFDWMHPIGDIVKSTNANFDPNLVYKGQTWQQIEDTFLWAAGSRHPAGETGGSADAVVVSHKHTIQFGQESGGALSGSTNNYRLTGSGFVHSSDYTGESGTGKNMPPFLAVYTWERTA